VHGRNIRTFAAVIGWSVLDVTIAMEMSTRASMECPGRMSRPGDECHSDTRDAAWKADEGERPSTEAASDEPAHNGAKKWSLAMKRSMGIFVLSIVAMLLANGFANASTVNWEGLTWGISGANTTAVVNGSGGLDVTVLGGQSGDPAPDNWVLNSLLPSNLTKANAPWVQFTFTDAYAGDSSVGGARGYVDTEINSWDTETMWQGGVLAGYRHYYLNHNVYDAPNGGWDNDPNNWYTGSTRTAGEHTVLFGMKTNGDTDMWIDGVLGQTIPASSNCTFFQRMYLGVDTSQGTTFTATYNDFQYGTGYVPEPATMSLLALGGVSMLIRRRRAAR
jgi:hypothetical protein